MPPVGVLSLYLASWRWKRWWNCWSKGCVRRQSAKLSLVFKVCERKQPNDQWSCDEACHSNHNSPSLVMRQTEMSHGLYYCTRCTRKLRGSEYESYTSYFTTKPWVRGTAKTNPSVRACLLPSFILPNCTHTVATSSLSLLLRICATFDYMQGLKASTAKQPQIAVYHK